jgi:ABC-2 type transport system permease protein
MQRLISAELRKITTTWSVWALLAAMVAFVVVSVLQTQTAGEATKLLWERQFYFLATLHGRLFLLIVGIKIATDDFRFGTIVPSALAVPRRGRIATAKLLLSALLGVLGASLAAAAMLTLAGGSLDGIDNREIASLAGYVAGGALWAAIGAGVGLLVRQQLGAIIGGIVWVMAAEQLLIARADDIASYLPGGAAGTFATAESTGAMLIGGAVLLAYALALGTGGTAAFLRRDLP